LHPAKTWVLQASVVSPLVITTWLARMKPNADKGIVKKF